LVSFDHLCTVSDFDEDFPYNPPSLPPRVTTDGAGNPVTSMRKTPIQKKMPPPTPPVPLTVPNTPTC